MNHTETGALQSFKVNVKLNFLIVSLNAFLNLSTGKTLPKQAYLLRKLRHVAAPAAPRKMISNKWKSVKASITQTNQTS